MTYFILGNKRIIFMICNKQLEVKPYGF